MASIHLPGFSALITVRYLTLITLITLPAVHVILNRHNCFRMPSRRDCLLFNPTTTITPLHQCVLPRCLQAHSHSIPHVPVDAHCIESGCLDRFSGIHYQLLKIRGPNHVRSKCFWESDGKSFHLSTYTPQWTQLSCIYTYTLSCRTWSPFCLRLSMVISF